MAVDQGWLLLQQSCMAGPQHCVTAGEKTVSIHYQSDTEEKMPLLVSVCLNQFKLSWVALSVGVSVGALAEQHNTDNQMGGSADWNRCSMAGLQSNSVNKPPFKTQNVYDENELHRISQTTIKRETARRETTEKCSHIQTQHSTAQLNETRVKRWRISSRLTRRQLSWDYLIMLIKNSKEPQFLFWNEIFKLKHFQWPLSLIV